MSVLSDIVAGLNDFTEDFSSAVYGLGKTAGTIKQTVDDIRMREFFEAVNNTPQSSQMTYSGGIAPAGMSQDGLVKIALVAGALSLIPLFFLIRGR